MKKSKLDRIALTKGQRVLKKKHGTPAEFAAACYQTVPSFCSMDEVRKAIDLYNKVWAGA